MRVKSMSPIASVTSVPARIPVGVVFVVALVLFAVLTLRADVRIVSSPGGAVDAYLAAFARVRQSGERVIIDGPCLSACTLVLSTIPRNHCGASVSRMNTTAQPARALKSRAVGLGASLQEVP